MQQNLIKWEALENHLKTNYNQLEAALFAFPWENRRAYGGFLAQLYYYTSHISRALSLAAARTPKEDPLHKVFVHGIAEEGEHDLLALADLRRLGYELSDFQELPFTRAYYQTLFYSIEFVSPVTLLGYAILLEGLAATRLSGVVDRLNTLYPKETTTFIRIHCQLDVEHAKEAEALLKTLPAENQSIIAKSIETSAAIYTQLINDTAKRFSRPTKSEVNELSA